MIITTTLMLVAILGFFAFLTAAALSPIESLSWWAGWNEVETSEADEDLIEPLVLGRMASPEPADDDAPLGDWEPPPLLQNDGAADQRKIIYLSGISTMAGKFLAPQESWFIDALRKAHPDADVITDVFPYSPSGKTLLHAPRVLVRFWRRAMRMRLRGRGFIAALANWRNFFQVLVSADHRYGPIFNLGASRVLIEALERHGYEFGSGAPVTIIGFSGGAQIGLGAATFLRPRLGAPIDIISIGGVMASDHGFNAVRRVYRLFGSRDRMRLMGSVFFAERWRIMQHSDWNQAIRNGTMITRKIGSMAHAGPRGYFGVQQKASGDGRYVDDTLRAVCDALAAIENDDTATSENSL